MAEPDTDRARRIVDPPTPFERLRGAPVMLALCTINLVVFAYLEYVAGGSDNVGTLLRFGALEPMHLWAGEYWRLGTTLLLQIGLVQLLMNTYFGFSWGAALEPALGKLRFLGVYLASGLAGALCSAIAGFTFAPHVTAGASGALFGIIGATIALKRRLHPDWPTFFADNAVRTAFAMVAIVVALSLAAHLDTATPVGGLLAGAAILGILTARRGPAAIVSGATRTPLWMALAVVYAALFAFAARPWWTPTGVHATQATALAAAHLDGRLAPDANAHHPRPSDIASGTRIATKACDRGVAASCEVLADYLFRTADPSNNQRAKDLEARACELDPPLCTQQH